MPHDPKIVEAVAQAISDRHAVKAGGCWAPSEIPDRGECADGQCYCAKRPRRDAIAALTALCAILHTAPEAMAAQMRGEAVVLPVEPVREMWAAGGNVLVNRRKRHHDAVLGDIWRDMRAASPFARGAPDAE